jgi:hypothetical protein
MREEKLSMGEAKQSIAWERHVSARRALFEELRTE